MDELERVKPFSDGLLNEMEVMTLWVHQFLHKITSQNIGIGTGFRRDLEEDLGADMQGVAKDPSQIRYARDHRGTRYSMQFITIGNERLVVTIGPASQWRNGLAEIDDKT